MCRVEASGHRGLGVASAGHGDFRRANGQQLWSVLRLSWSLSRSRLRRVVVRSTTFYNVLLRSTVL